MVIDARAETVSIYWKDHDPYKVSGAILVPPINSLTQYLTTCAA
jgi:hypothetical protein